MSYGHAPCTTACAELGCATPAIVADDNEPGLTRCVPHAMELLLAEAGVVRAGAESGG